MTEIEQSHQEMVRALAKPGKDIIKELDPIGAHILHMAVGISGEAGEIIDAVKKATVYNQKIDRDNIIEELGDLEFYMHGLRDALKISRQETLMHNMKKLSKRYEGFKYSDEQAKKRNDKQD